MLGILAVVVQVKKLCSGVGEETMAVELLKVS